MPTCCQTLSMLELSRAGTWVATLAPSLTPSSAPSTPATPEWSEIAHWLTEALPAILKIAPLLAVLVAGAALWVAISSRRLAGRVHQLNAQKEARQAPLLSMDVIEGLQHIAINRDQRIHVHVQVTNRSEVATSLRDARLWVQHRHDAGLASEEISPTTTDPREPALVVPTTLTPRSTIQGWLRFDLPQARIAGWTVASYDLVVRDADARITRYDGLALKREK